jgi:hypothetical protein
MGLVMNSMDSGKTARLSEADLLAYLHHSIPASALDCRADELGTNVALAEVFLVHPAVSVT